MVAIRIDGIQNAITTDEETLNGAGIRPFSNVTVTYGTYTGGGTKYTVLNNDSGGDTDGLQIRIAGLAEGETIGADLADIFFANATISYATSAFLGLRTATISFERVVPDANKAEILTTGLRELRLLSSSDKPPGKHGLSVTVIDPKADEASFSTTVNITPFNDGPPISETEKFGTQTGTGAYAITEGTRDISQFFFGRDPETGERGTRFLLGDDSALFELDEQGFLRFRSTPDFETPRDEGRDNVYKLLIVTKDASGSQTEGFEELPLTITVRNTVEAATLTGLTGLLQLNENLANEQKQVIDADIGYAGGEAPARLLVTGLLAEDVVSIEDFFIAGGVLYALDNGTVSRGGQAIGTLGGGNGTAMRIDFNAQARPGDVDVLLDHVTYQNTSDTPGFSRTLTFRVYDSAGGLANHPATPSFAELTGTANPLGGIGVGSYSAPLIVDLAHPQGPLDRDGKPDLVVGTNEGGLAVWRNTGNYAWVDGFPPFGTHSIEQPGGVPLDVGIRAAPTAADLDGDGIEEIVVGATDGQLRLLKLNTASDLYVEVTGAANPFAAASHQWLVLGTGTVNGNVLQRPAIDVGLAAAPVFGDIDGDGRADLVVGNEQGQLVAYKNLGPDFRMEQTVFEIANYGLAEPAPAGFLQFVRFEDLDDLRAVFGGLSPIYARLESPFSANPLAGIQVTGTASPALADLDLDGKLDLVVGNEQGTLGAWRNTGTGFVPFTVNPFAGIDVGGGARPFFYDLDGDLLPELVVGGSDGTLRAWRNATNPGARVEIQVQPQNDVPRITVPSGLSFVEGGIDAVVGFQVQLTDPDGGNSFARWSLGGVDAGSFTISQTGLIAFKALPDYESPTDSNGDNIYQLGVSYFDGFATASQGMTVTVTDSVETSRVTGLNGTLLTSEQAAPIFLDADVAFTPGWPVANQQFVVSGLAPGDVVAIASEGTAVGKLGTISNALTYNTQQIGTFSGGQGSNLVVNLNGSASRAAVERLIERLTFQNTSDTPQQSRTLVIDMPGGADGSLNGPAGARAYVEQTGTANPFAGIAVGTLNTAPALLDLNGDGRMDVTFGNVLGFLDSWANVPLAAELVGYDFWRFGDAENPLAGIAAPGGIGNVAPAFGDIDGDGRKDLVLGSGFGTYAWKNTPSGFVPFATNPMPNPASAPTNTDNTATLVNLDSDAALELVVGTATSIHAFDWNGTAFVQNAATFAGQVTADYRGIQFLDLNGDAWLDFITGSDDGRIRAWLRDPPPIVTPVALADARTYSEMDGSLNPFRGIDVGDRSRPYLGDVDGDGFADLVVGSGAGDIRFFRNLPAQPSITIQVTPVNDAPVPTVPASPVVAAVEEGFTGVVHRFVVTDADASMQLRLFGDDAALFTIDQDDGEIRFAAAPNFETPADRDRNNGYAFTVGYEDYGNPGGTGTHFNPSVYAVTVNVTDVNEPTSLAGLPTTLAFTEGQAAWRLFGAADFTAGTALGGATLSVSGLDAADVIAILNVGTGAGQIGYVGGQVSVGGVTFATATGGVGTDFVITFGANATEAMADQLIDFLTFYNGDDSPTATRALTFIYNGLNGQQFQAGSTTTTTLTVRASNDAPVIGNEALSVGYVYENSTSIAFQATGSDADGDTITWSISGFDSAYLQVDPQTGAVRLKQPADFENLPADAPGGVFEFNLTASDGRATATGKFGVVVLDVNEGSSLTGFGPLMQTTEGAPAALLDDAVVFQRIASLAGAQLVVSGLVAGDEVSVRHDGAPGTIGFAGGVVSYDGTAIGTATGGAGGDLVVSLNAAATAQAVDALIEALTFRNASPTVAASRTLRLDVVDSEGAHLTGGPPYGQAIVVEVAAVGQAPTGPAHVVLPAVDEDNAVILSQNALLAGWSDPDGDAISIVNLSSATRAFARIDIGSDVIFVAQPPQQGQEFVGPVLITFGVSDGVKVTAASAEVPLTPENDAPFAQLGYGLPAIDEDSTATINAADLLALWIDPEGDELTASNVSASVGTVQQVGPDEWEYTPPSDYVGNVVFFFDVSDGTATVSGGNVVLFVVPVNDAPAGPGNIVLPSLPEDTDGLVTAADLLAGWTDIDTIELSVVSLTSSTPGAVVESLGGGTWRVRGAPDDEGAVSLSYVVSDGTDTAAGTATIDLTQAAEQPQSPGDVQLTALDEDGSRQITAAQLLAGWSHPDNLPLSVLDLVASAGTLTPAGDGLWTFTAPADDSTGALFSYVVSDGAATVAGSASMDLLPTLDAPTGPAVVELSPVAEDFLTTINEAALLAGWSDADADQLTVLNLVASSGTLTPLAGGGWSFRGAVDDDSFVDFTYLISDGTTAVGGAARLDLLSVTAGRVLTGNSRANSIAGGSDNDTVSGLAGSDSLYGNGGNDALLGSTDNDLLDGGDGFDRLRGGSGDDSLYGGDDADTLSGDDGIDLMEGGNGNDLYDLVGPGDIIVETSGGGRDTVRSRFTWSLEAEVEDLVLVGTAEANGTGNELANVVTGNAAANALDGGDGDDQIFGRDGNDTLRGGLGADTLNGESGADVFFYGSAAEGDDRIIAYRGATDTIQVSGAGFGLVAGTDLVATSRYAANAAGTAVGGLGQFVYDTNDFRLWWDEDGSGGIGPVLIANLAGLTNWSGAEIVVV